MFIAAAIACALAALVAGFFGLTGVVKGMAGAAKALFFFLLALGAVGAGVTFYLKQHAGN